MLPTFNLNRFDLTSLRLFVAIVEGGSLTVGAERFSISLAAASKRISELEAHVGSTLLARSKKGVVPTAAGLTFMRYAIEIVARLEQLSLAMGDFHRGAGGHLRLWANTSAFTGFLPAALARYSTTHPSVMLDLEDAMSEDVVRAVARGNAELGVIGDNTPAEGLQSLLCDTDELILIMPKGHALAGQAVVAIDEVLGYDIIGLNRATSLMRQIAAAADARGQALKIRVQVRGFDEVCRMIAEGLGIGVLPKASIAPHVKSLGLSTARLTGMNTRRRLLLVMRDRLTLSAPARDFVELVEARGGGSTPTEGNPA